MPFCSTAKHYRFACIIALFSANFAIAQIQQSALTASLKGVEAVGIVTIGDSGVPAGVAANNALPVNTLIYPDGQIIYRVEFGLVRGEVVRMQKSFGNGTVFQVSSVDFKDDRLELKLAARNRDSGRLKLMLGQGWQARMSNQDVISIIMKFLTLPAASSSSNSPSVAIASSAPNSSPQIVSRSPAPSLYQRPATAAVIVGRPSGGDIQAVFTEFQREKGVAEDNVVRASQPLSQALRAFESVFSDPRQRAQGMIQPMIDLQGRIGPDLIPKTSDDVDAMDALFDRCLRVARMRSAGDQTGREYGPGSNSPTYLKAFLSRDAAGEHDRTDRQLREALQSLAQVESTEDEVLKTEQALDRGQLRDANEYYISLSAGNSSQLAAVLKYVEKNANFENDIASYLKASSGENDTLYSVAALFQRITSEEEQISTSTGLPLTAALLQKRLDLNKASLEKRLQEIAALTIDPALYSIDRPKHSAGSTKAADLDAESTQLSRLDAALKPTESLSAITNDQNKMKLIHLWYGDALATALITKSRDLTTAWTAEAALTAQVEGLRIQQAQVEARKQAELAQQQRLRDQEAARRAALVQERNSLAGTITNSALIITMLDEKFKLTEVMGYQMESDKRRKELFNLLRKDSAMLTPSLWAEVNSGFQRVLPGLTVWQASHVQAIFGECRGLGK